MTIDEYEALRRGAPKGVMSIDEYEAQRKKYLDDLLSRGGGRANTQPTTTKTPTYYYTPPTQPNFGNTSGTSRIRPKDTAATTGGYNPARDPSRMRAGAGVSDMPSGKGTGNPWDRIRNHVIRERQAYPNFMTERPEDYNDRDEEYDRELYDFYYGKGKYDTISRKGNRDEILRRMSDIRDLWRDFDNGNVAKVASELQAKTKNEKKYKTPEDIDRYGEGNIDLDNRQVVRNSDGSISTERSFSVNIDGKEVLLPTVVNGMIVSEEEAIRNYEKTGEYLGKFNTPEEADEYAELLHERQEKRYNRPETLEEKWTRMSDPKNWQVGNPEKKTIGGQERAMTPYEIYSLDPEKRKEAADQLLTDASYKGWLEGHAFDRWNNLENEEEDWKEVSETSNNYTGMVGEVQDASWEMVTSPIIREKKTIPMKLLERLKTDSAHTEENNRELYDTYYGAGMYDRIINRNRPDDLVRMQGELDDLWKDFDSGVMQRLADIHTGLWEQEGQYDVQKSMGRTAEGKLNEIEYQKGQRENYYQLMEDYPAMGTNYEWNPENDKGTTNPNNIRAEIVSNNQTTNIHRIASFIAGGNERKSWEAAMGMEGKAKVTPDYKYAMMLLDDEKQRFMERYNAGEYKEAEAFLDGLLSTGALQTRYEEAQKIQFGEFVRQAPVTANVLGVAARQGSGLMALPRTIAGFFGDESVKNRHSGWYTATEAATMITDESQKQITEKFGETAGKVYRAFGESVNDVLTGLLTKGMAGDSALLQRIFGYSNFASQVYQEQTFRNMETMDYTTASLLAALDSVSEVVEEWMPFENMLSSVGKGLGRAVVDSVISNALEEGAGSTILEKAKGWITGHDTEQQRADEIIAQRGYEDKNGEWVSIDVDKDPGAALAQANKQAAIEFIQNFKESVIAGGLGGGFGGTYGTFATMLGLQSTGKKIRNQENTTSEGQTGDVQLVEAAKGMKGTESQQLANEIDEETKKGKKPSNYKIGKLAALMMDETNEQYKAVVHQTIVNRITNQLKERGLSGNRLAETAEAMARSLSGEKMTREDQQIIAREQAAIDLWKSYNSIMSDTAAGLIKEVNEATKDARSVANLVGELAGETGTATSVIADEVNRSIRETDSVEGAIDNLAERRYDLISYEYAEEAKNVAKEEKNQKYFLDDAVKIRLAAFSLAPQMPKVHMSEKSASILWEKAKAEFQEAEAKRRKNQAAVVPGKGKATFNGAEHGTAAWNQAVNGSKKISGRAKLQMNVIAEIAEKMGNTVRFYYDNRIERMKGGSVYNHAYVHGYETPDGAIAINVAGLRLSGMSKNMLVTLAHEMTHWLEQNSMEGYAKLRQFIVGQLGAENVQQRLVNIINNQAAVLTAESGTDRLDLSGAMAELVAQSSESLFSTKAMRDKLAEENPTLFDQVKKYVRQFIARLDAAIKDLDPNLSDEAKQLKQWREQIAKLWLEAREEALGREAGGEEAEEGGVSFSTASNINDFIKDRTNKAAAAEKLIRNIPNKQNIDIRNMIKNLQSTGYITLIQYIHNAIEKKNRVLTKKIMTDFINKDKADIRKNASKIVDGWTNLISKSGAVAYVITDNVKTKGYNISSLKNGIHQDVLNNEPSIFVEVKDTHANIRIDRDVIDETVEKNYRSRVENKYPDITEKVLREIVPLLKGSKYIGNHENYENRGTNVHYYISAVKEYGDIIPVLFAVHDAVDQKQRKNFSEKAYIAEILIPDSAVSEEEIKDANEKGGLTDDSVNIQSTAGETEADLRQAPPVGASIKDILEKVNTSMIRDFDREEQMYKGMSLSVAQMDREYEEAVKNEDWEKAENMLLDKMQQTSGITGYRAPHFYAGEHKDIARLIKSGNQKVINSIVDDMARNVPDNAVLIPIPPHEGKVTDSTDTMILARALSEATGAPVINALESEYHESRYQAKKSNNRSVTADTMGFRQIAEIPEGKMPVFVDNMVGGGQTAIAAKNAVGRGITLAYAQSSRAKSAGVKVVSVTYDKNGNLIPLSQRMDPENPSWKYSVEQMDREYLATVNLGYFGSAEKMVDEAAKKAGYTIKAYHGTPNGKFNVFDKSKVGTSTDFGKLGRGFYFTTKKQVADYYAGYLNSSTVLPVYLKLDNPFVLDHNYDNMSVRELYDSILGKGGIVDEQRSEELTKWLVDNGYDGIVADNEYMVLDPKNIKSAETVTYDKYGDIIPLSERFRTDHEESWKDKDIRYSVARAEEDIQQAIENPGISFSMANVVEATRDGLVAVHNLTERNLRDTLTEDGFTAPSIAVVKAKTGHSKYGTISVIFKSSAINPKTNRRNKIYGQDAWTPTRSNAQIETRLNYEVLQKAKNTISKLLSSEKLQIWENDALNWINRWLYEDQTTDTIEEMIQRAYDNDGMIVAYEIAQGRKIEEKTTFEKNHPDLQGQMIGLYNEFLDHLEEIGMLQEFMDDMDNETSFTVLNKYLDIFGESGEKQAQYVAAYKKNPDSKLNRNVVFNKMKQARWFQQDGREIKLSHIFSKELTADAIREKYRENGKEKKAFEDWVEGLVGSALGERGVRNGADLFTYSGNKRSFKQTHWEPTAENIVKAMYMHHEAKGGEAGGATGLMAKASKEYRDLDEVRKDSARLQILDEEEYKAKVQALDEKIRKFVEELSKTSGVSYYEIKEALIDAGGEYAKNTAAQTINRYMIKQGIQLTTDQLIEAQGLMEEAREIPAGYFEAKPERVVGYDEIEKIIMPETVSQDIKDALDERGITWETYDGTDEGRLEALNKDDSYQFSVAQPDMEVTTFMQGLNENSLSTEQERVMFRQWKELKAAWDLNRHALDERTRELQKLEKKPNPTAYERDQIRKMKILIQNSERRMADTEAKMVRATTQKGFAKIMSENERIMRNLVSGRTNEEVRKTVEALTKQIEAVDREMAERQKKIDEMREGLRQKKIATLIDQKAAEKLAALIRKENNSNINKQELIQAITEIRLKMAARKNISEDVEELAWKIIAGIQNDGGAELRSLRGTTITLGAGQVKELLGKNSSIKELRSIFAGTGIKVRVAKDGEMGLDTDWEQLCDAVPNLDRNAKELQQVDELIRFVQDQKRQMDSTKQFQGQIDEFREDLAAMIATVGLNVAEDPAAMRAIEQMGRLIDNMSAGIQASAQELQQAREQIRALIDQGKLAISQQDAMQYDIDTAIKYNNALAIQSEAATWKSERWKLIEKLRNENTQKLLEEQMKWKQKIAQDKQAREMMASNQQMRKAIHTNVSRIWKLLARETDQQNIPEHMKGLAREMVGMVVNNDLYGRKISGFGRKDLFEMSRVLEIMKKQDGEFTEDDLKLIEDEEAQDMVLEALANLEEGIKFYNASTGGGIIVNLQAFRNALERIDEAVVTITNVIHAEQSINIQDRKIAVADAAEEIAFDMRASRFKGERVGRGSRQKNAIESAAYYGNLTPVYFIKNLKNRGISQLWEEMKRGQNRNGLEVQKAQNFLRGLAERTNFSKWSEEKHTVRIGSRDVEMSVGQMMELYAIWKREMLSMTENPQASSHLRNGGIILQEEARDTGKPGRERQNTKPMRVRDEDVGAMYDQLTDEQKTYLDEVVKYLSSDMSDLGNEASMKKYGIKKYKEAWYFPMKVWDGVKSARSDRGISGTNENRAAHKGWSKRRINKAQNALVIGDFTKDAVQHIVEMINYNTMAPAIENFNKILNYQRTEADDNGEDIQGVKRNIRVMFGEAYGKNALNYLETFLSDMNGGLVQDQRTTLRDRMISVFRKNAVAGSLSVALQQPLSYIRAAMMINPKYLAQAISPTYWKGSHAEMTKYSGVAVIKDMGRFDMQMGASAREYIAPEDKSTYDKISDALTILPEMMDRMTWTRMWSAVKLEQHALHPEMDIRSEEFLKLCGERFNDIMMQTQVYDSVMVKSHNMRSSNGFMKMMTSFMAEPTLSLNILGDAVMNAKGKEGMMNLGKAGATFALAAVMQAFFKGLMGSGRSPDEKKTWLENFLNKWQQNFISEANPLSLIPGYGDLIELLKNGELKDDAMGVLGKLLTAFNLIRDTASGKKDFGYRTIEDTAAQIAQLFTNIPAKNIMRDMRAMYNYVSQAPYAKRPTSGAVLREQRKANRVTADNLIGTLNTLLGEAGFVTSNKAYYGRMFDAMQRGNQAAENDIHEYLTLAKGQDEKAIQSGLRTQAKAKLEPAEASAWMIQHDMMETSSTLTTQYKKGEISKAEYKKLLKKQDPKLTEDDLWWKIDRVDFQKETRAESVSGYSYRLKAAIGANSATAIQKAVKDMKDHGRTQKQILDVTSDWKSVFLAADNNGRRRIRDAIQKTYKAAGSTAAEADKKIDKWLKESKKSK